MDKNLGDIVTKEGPGINGYVTNFAGSGLSGSEIVQLNDLANSVARNGMICVDVGVAKGSSTAAMAMKAKEFNGSVFCVDDYRNFKRYPDQWAQASCIDIFWGNMKYLELDKNIILLETDSFNESKNFVDESLDLVFIDASHNYNEVARDIKSWLPKVRQGGIIAGHDCQIIVQDGKYDLRPWQNVSIETTGYDQHDFSLHVGVVLAVSDSLPQAQVLPESTIWWYKK